jgi:hypothetical protein
MAAEQRQEEARPEQWNPTLRAKDSANDNGSQSDVAARRLATSVESCQWVWLQALVELVDEQMIAWISDRNLLESAPGRHHLDPQSGIRGPSGVPWPGLSCMP